ncbi:MAG TPA: GNAT family N-acetyltransferase [Thermoanaerobaculia bacterium]|nr:GNAT family N-acetyltransferase [Thermoanaerobaculia bacterium]
MYPAYDTKVLLRPASLYSTADLVGMWSLAYADYFSDLQFDERRLATHLAVHDIDLGRSVVIETEEKEFVGLSLLSMRGARGWIGGFGINPKHRRQGHSAILIRSQLAVAHGAGLGSVQLEVLMQNWAGKVYERAGFTPVRQLFVLRGRVETAAAADGVELVSPRQALQHIQQMRCGQIWPWQRELATVTKGLTPTTIGAMVTLADGSSGALVCDRGDDNAVRILDIAGGPASVAPLLAVVRQLYDDREALLMNEPADSDLHPYLLQSGLKPIWIQREMVLHFDLAPEG